MRSRIEGAGQISVNEAHRLSHLKVDCKYQVAGIIRAGKKISVLAQSGALTFHLKSGRLVLAIRACGSIVKQRLYFSDSR